MAVVSYPARAKTGNRAKDVLNPLFKQSEDLVLAWLQENNYGVRDARGEKTFYDFRIGAAGREPIYALDVKTDQYAQTTGRVAWEVFVELRSSIREGWGRDERLDYVAFVTPGDWCMYLVDAEIVRNMLARMDRGFDMPDAGEVVPFQKVGTDGRIAHGIAISLAWLRRYGAIKREVVVATTD